MEEYKHSLVSFITDEDGYPANESEKKWHWVTNVDASRSLCGGQVFGYGESRIKYKIKTVKKGGITCPECLRMIKEFQEIKL